MNPLTRLSGKSPSSDVNTKEYATLIHQFYITNFKKKKNMKQQPPIATRTLRPVTIILPVVLYWYETWSLILREERKLRVFENMVLRRIFGRRRDEVPGEWRRLHNEELNDLYSSPNIVRVIKSIRMRWAGHVARMGEERGRIGSWWGNRRERDHWGDLGVDGWIILRWISRRWTGLGWLRTGTGGGSLWVR